MGESPTVSPTNLQGLDRLVILFEGRSGSSYLVNLLNNRAGVVCFPELLPPLREQQEKEQLLDVFKGSGRVWHINPYALSPNYYSMDPSEKVADPRIQAVGMKTKLRDTGNRWLFRKFLESNDCKIVYLRRRNQVKATISEIRARKLHQAHGGWNARDPGMVVPPVEIDLEEFDRLYARRKRIRAESSRYFKRLRVSNKLAIAYEDLLEDPDATVDRILTEFGLPLEKLGEDVRLVKNTANDVRESITNYPALMSHLPNRKAREMLKEGRNKR